MRKIEFTGACTEKPKVQRVLFRRILAGALLWGFTLAAPFASVAQCRPHTAVRRNAVNQADIEELQRRVNEGDDPWRVEARPVAYEELVRHVPALKLVEPSSLALRVESQSETRAVFVWVRGDSRAAYRITLRRYRWQAPAAERWERVVWIAERTEIMALN